MFLVVESQRHRFCHCPLVMIAFRQSKCFVCLVRLCPVGVVGRSAPVPSLPLRPAIGFALSARLRPGVLVSRRLSRRRLSRRRLLWSVAQNRRFGPFAGLLSGFKSKPAGCPPAGRRFLSSVAPDPVIYVAVLDHRVSLIVRDDDVIQYEDPDPIEKLLELDR